MKKIKYDIEKYPFGKILQNVFDVGYLHEINDDVQLFSRETDQSTIFHKKYYEWTLTDEFITLYDNFILDIIRPLYDEKIVYQSIPTFRIAYQNNIAVGEFHKDKFYRDEKWTKDVKEDNFFLPFTDAFDTNTIWAETIEDLGDFIPLNCNYGEIIQWDGSNLMHGNNINKTGKTRVSVDFRVIKYSNYKPSEHLTINTKTKFKVGGYYKITNF